MALSLPGVTVRRGFGLGFLTGIVHFAGTLYWTSGTVSTFGGLALPVAVFVAGLLVLYMALFVAAAAAASAALIGRFGAAGLLLAPAAWVSAEYLRAHLFGGFPWIPLGNAVVRLLPLAQLASVGGVYLLSWLLATLNAAFALAALSRGRRRTAIGADRGADPHLTARARDERDPAAVPVSHPVSVAASGRPSRPRRQARSPACRAG